LERRSNVKRLISLAVAAMFLILSTQAFAVENKSLAVENNSLFWNRAVAYMNLNNGTLKKLANSEMQAEKRYKSSVDQAKTINTKGVTVKFGNEDMFFPFDDYTQVMMTKQKELSPEQMRFSWESAKNSRIITQNTLNVSLRGVYLGLFSAKSDLNLKQKKLVLAENIHNQDLIRQKNGSLTELDMEESEYNLLKVQKGADSSGRNYDNAVRNFDQFVGLPVKTQFSEILYEEKLNVPALKDVDYYIQTALAERFDMISINTQISLKEKEKAIIETHTSYKVYTRAQDEYEALLNDMERLGMDKESTRLSITDGIRAAYVEIVNTGKSVVNLKNTLQLQNNRLASVKAEYGAGLVSKNLLDQTGTGVDEMENAYNAALFDYNTKLMKFKNATGIGPGY